jgi:hypothetical protein
MISSPGNPQIINNPAGHETFRYLFRDSIYRSLLPVLDEYCNSLPDATQVAMAIRLIEIALPAWETHVTEHPGDLDRINTLITKDHWVRGGAHQVVKPLPRVSLLELKRTIDAGASLKDNPILQSQFATFMEPLTIPAWDEIFPLPSGLPFTAVWNLLTYLFLRKVTKANETHVYMAINQACDAILQKQFLSSGELDHLLKEYEHFQATPLVDNVTESSPRSAECLSFSIETMFASSFRKIPANCPLCGSRDISEEPVGIEFTRMHCNACGNDVLCDDWQLDDWYR